MKSTTFIPLALFFILVLPNTIHAQVNGYNVTQVNYNSGSFRQISTQQWVEYTSGGRQFNFVETQRDEWSVYLLDQSRNTSIQLDLWRKEIFIHWERPERAKLYDILGSSAAALTSQDRGPEGFTRITGENGSHYFQNRVDVAYGARGRYFYINNVSGRVNFNNTTFGDPYPGVVKSGYYRIRHYTNEPVVDPNIVSNTVNPISNTDMQLVLGWIAAEVADANVAYCYKDSYPRGAGSPLSACPPGMEKDGALCYPRCQQGFKGVGPVCWQKCPGSFTDTGGHCLKPKAYGRGAGYPWKFGDALNLNAARKRCLRDHPQGCEKSGEIIYPKCRPGFHPVGCCVCSPNCPAGMTDIGVSCQKKSYGRTAGKPMICGAGLEQNAALCYRPCRAGFYGVGPVCWRSCPPNQPVDCAAGCAKSTADCVEKTVNQVTAVAELAANIISMGSTSKLTAAKASLKTAIKAGDRVAAKAAMKQTVKAFAEGFERLTTRRVVDKLKEKFRKESAKWVREEYAKVQMKLAMQEEFSAEDLRDLAGLDPTGVAQVVEAFWQPVCNEPNPFPVLSRNY